jgi:hypothetical protein
MRLEVQLSTAPIGYVGIELGRREVGVPEHLLNRPQVCAALEEMRREGVAQEVRVNAFRLEPGAARKPAQDQECARAREPAALSVEEELGPVAAIEVRPAVREVAPQRLDRVAPDRNDALLAALARAADEPLLEVDAGAIEPHRLAHA